LLSGTYSDFQIPANPGQTPFFALAGASPKNFNSRFLSENQHEQNHFAILAYQKSLKMSASSWQHLPGTAQLYLHRMMRVILSSPAWQDGSIEASFRTVFSLTRAGQSMIVTLYEEGFLSRRKLRESARITRFFRLTPQEIRHPMFRSQSSTTRARLAPITVSICRTHGK
jgi:hypothetical protein